MWAVMFLLGFVVTALALYLLIPGFRKPWRVVTRVTGHGYSNRGTINLYLMRRFAFDTDYGVELARIHLSDDFEEELKQAIETADKHVKALRRATGKNFKTPKTPNIRIKKPHFKGK